MGTQEPFRYIKLLDDIANIALLHVNAVLAVYPVAKDSNGKQSHRHAGTWCDVRGKWGGVVCRRNTNEGVSNNEDNEVGE